MGKASSSVTSMVRIEPLSAPHMPTWPGSVASERVMKPGSKLCPIAPLAWSFSYMLRSSGIPSPLPAAARSSEAETASSVLPDSRLGSASSASRTSVQALSEIRLAPPAPYAASAASPTASLRPAEAKASLPPPARNCCASTGSPSAGKSSGSLSSVRWNPPSPLAVIVTSRKARNAAEISTATRPTARNRRSAP